MSKLIYTYALIKAFYDQGKDFIDAFWPFAIKIIPFDDFVFINEIKSNLNRQFSLNIPLHVLEVILTRAKRKKFLVQEKISGRKRYKLTKEGVEYINKLESEREVERRINSFLADVKDFFKNKGIVISVDRLYSLMLSIIHNNLDLFVEFINLNDGKNFSLQKFSKLEERTFIEYLMIAENSKPEYYNTFKELVFGSIISVVLNARESFDINTIGKRKFKKLHVYLDTNFIFSIFDFHAKELNEPAKELLELLRRFKFKLMVFDFTINEICRVLSLFSQKYQEYPKDLRINSVYNNLLRKGWKISDVQEFIANIENELTKFGINIMRTNIINLEKYQPQEEKLRDIISKYKPAQDLFHQNHDLAVIEEIRKIRKKPIREIEKANAIFLTSDLRLSRFNFYEMGHKDNGTICEVISDKLLTNILWLKDPQIDLPLKQIIAVHSKDLFINRIIWERFYSILQKLKQEKKINDEQISILFYHNYIEQFLIEMDENDIDQVNEEFIFGKIKEIEKKIKELVECEAERKFKAKVEEFERSKEEQNNLKQMVEENLKKMSEKEARWISIGIAIIVSILLLVLSLVLKDLYKILFGSSGIIGVIGLRKKVYLYLSDKIYSNKLKNWDWKNNS